MLNKPTEDILHQNLIIVSKLGINKIDVSGYNIKIPNEGIFVAVEWLRIELSSFDTEEYYDQNLKKGHYNLWSCFGRGF